MKYKVKLYRENFISTFEINDKRAFINSWKGRELIVFDKPNGDSFSYNLNEFYGMEIEKIK